MLGRVQIDGSKDAMLIAEVLGGQSNGVMLSLPRRFWKGLGVKQQKYLHSILTVIES